MSAVHSLVMPLVSIGIGATLMVMAFRDPPAQSGDIVTAPVPIGTGRASIWPPLFFIGGLTMVGIGIDFLLSGGEYTRAFFSARG